MKLNIFVFIIFIIFISCKDKSPTSQNDNKYSISGTVTEKNDTLKAIPGVLVSISNNIVTTDSSGYFLLENIDPGEKQIYFSHESYIDCDTTINVIRDIEINVRLQKRLKKYKISGTVLDANDQLKIKTISGVEVTISGINATTDNSGFFLFENIDPGGKKIYFSHESYINFDTTINVIKDLDISVRLQKNMFLENPHIKSVLFKDGSFTIKWNTSKNPDFNKYQLFESVQQDTSSWQLIFTTNNIDETVYSVDNVANDEYRYYKLGIKDNYNRLYLSSRKIATPFTLIAFPQLIDNEDYYSSWSIYTIDINGNGKLAVPNTTTEFDKRLDPQIFINDQIFYIETNAGEYESSYYLYSIETDGTNPKQVTSNICRSPIFNQFNNMITYVEPWGWVYADDQSNHKFGDLFQMDYITGQYDNLTAADSFIVLQYEPAYLDENTVLFTTQSDHPEYAEDVENITRDIYLRLLNDNYNEKYLSQAIYPCISPNGTYLLYQKCKRKWYNENDYQMELYSFVDSTTKELSRGLKNFYSFSNNENKIAYSLDYPKVVYLYDIPSESSTNLGIGQNPKFINNDLLIWYNLDFTLTLYNLNTRQKIIVGQSPKAGHYSSGKFFMFTIQKFN